jgi:hypothetical protein
LQHNIIILTLLYIESSVLIATRSCLLPSPISSNSDIDSAGLGLPTEMTAQSHLDIDALSMELECIGEESFINICELQLIFDGVQLGKSTDILWISNHTPFYLLPAPRLGLAVSPLPPIVDCIAQLNNLEFLCLPSAPRQPFSPSKIIKKDSGLFFLASSYLDFGDCKLLRPLNEDSNVFIYSRWGQTHTRRRLNSSCTQYLDARQRPTIPGINRLGCVSCHALSSSV